MDMHLGQRDITVFSSFALTDVEHPAIKIQVFELQVAKFKTAKATAIKHRQYQTVFKKFGCFEQLLYLITA